MPQKNKSLPGPGFAVVDTNDVDWARYSYEAMAESVRARCNDDPALKSRAPFTVQWRD